MGLLDFIASTRFKRLTSLSMIAEAALAALRGDTRIAALLAGAAAVALRSSWAGLLAELGIRVYQWRR